MANKTGIKFGGRQAGTANKTTTEIKAILTEFVSNNIVTMQQDFDSIKEPHLRLQMMEKLLKFILPTNVKNDMTIEGNEHKELVVKVVYSDVPIARREEDVDISRNI